jgi:hypothetical protein
MAFNALPIVAVAVAVTLLLRKGGEATSETVKPEPEPEPEPSPDPDPDPAPKPAPTKSEVARAAQWKLIPRGYALPDGITHKDIWVSSDCQAAVMGRDWEPTKRFGDTGNFNPDQSARAIWNRYAEGAPPIEGVGGDLSHVEGFSAVLMNDTQSYGTAPCEMPSPSDFDTAEEWGNEIGRLQNQKPALMDLYDQVYDRVESEMMYAWALADWDAYVDFQVARTAQWAKVNHPNLSLEDQTDEAYGRMKQKFVAFDPDYEPSFPDVLDPNNPDHEGAIQLWIDLRDSIASL